MAETDGQGDGRMTVLICLLLAAMVWIVFGQTVHFEFVNYDDPGYVCNNPAIVQGLSWEGILWTFSHVNVGTWFPLTDISHQLCWQLFGSNAGGHHLVNVLLHATTAIVLFLALQKLTGGLWPCALVAAVFAIHPLRVESVAWVAERKDVLSGLFFVLTLWAWAGHVVKKVKLANVQADHKMAKTARHQLNWTPDYGLALLFFTLGLLSKPMLVTLPFVLLLLDYWPLNRQPAANQFLSRSWFRAWLGLIAEKTPFFLLSVATCVVTIKTQKNEVMIAQNLTHLWRVGNALTAYMDYLGHMIYPVGLALTYPHSVTDPTLRRAVLAALILSAITVAAIAGRRRHPYLLTGWLWYLGMLLPVIDIVQVENNARADRYTYLPQIGLAIMVVWGAVALANQWRRRWVLVGVMVVMLAALTLDAYVQTGYWKNSESLWTRTIDCYPDNSFAYNNKGSVLANEQRWAEATVQYRQAILIEPDYADALVNLGVALVNQDKRNEGVECFQRALKINPFNTEAHYNLGDSLAAEGKTDEAIANFEQAIHNRPNYAEAHYDLGLSLGLQGKWDAAREHFEQAFHSTLDAADARYISGIAQAAQKKWPAAIVLYQQALELKSDFTEAHYRLGVALAGQKKWAEARQSFKNALGLIEKQGNEPLAETIRNEIKNCEAALSQLPKP